MRTPQKVFWFAGAVCFFLLPAVSQAAIIFAADNPLNLSGKQTINFAQQPDGTTAVGDTNPPPQYFFDFQTTDAGVTLHPNGNGIDTVNSTGFNNLTVTPELSTLGFTYIDFQADSLQKFDPTIASLTLTATYVDSSLVTHTESATLFFPYEKNQGDSQHYYVQSTLGDVMTKLSISYNPSGETGHTDNTIQDIHNWDVVVAQNPVPEPSSIIAFGLSMAAFGVGSVARRRLSRNARWGIKGVSDGLKLCQ